MFEFHLCMFDLALGYLENQLLPFVISSLARRNKGTI